MVKYIFWSSYDQFCPFFIQFQINKMIWIFAIAYNFLRKQCQRFGRIFLQCIPTSKSHLYIKLIDIANTSFLRFAAFSAPLIMPIFVPFCRLFVTVIIRLKIKKIILALRCLNIIFMYFCITYFFSNFWKFL